MVLPLQTHKRPDSLHADSFKHFKTVGKVTDLLTIIQNNPETHSECSNVLPIFSGMVSHDAKSSNCDLGFSYLWYDPH